MIKKITLFLLVSLIITTTVNADILPSAISTMINKSGLKSNELGIYIKETKSK